jgi:aminoglycoside phosphotransferase (APT) family kinase protein
MDPLATSLVPLDGGWSGETFLAEAAGERTVVRIYARPGGRGAEAHEVDAALLRLVRGLLPVAEVLEVRRADPAAGLPALLVTSFLPGTRADLLLPTLDTPGLETLGRNLGAMLARLSGMPMLRAGTFVDSSLRIEPFPAEVTDLLEWLDAHESALALAPDELDGLRTVAAAAQADLDTVERACLVHSDVNPKNLLVDPDTLEVTGVVDWEYAHAGSPYSDLGNLLRFDREPAFAAGVLGEYAARLDVDAHGALELARAADLFALVELASRRGQNPVADRAHARLRAIGLGRDRHASE